MKKTKKQSQVTTVFLGVILSAVVAHAAPKLSEEARLVQIVKKLKPISDSQWNEIAQSHMSDTYDIQKGDTLWDVSKRLFGNSYYWPKVWALNNAKITNPHFLNPGQKIAFTPGSSESAPEVKQVTAKDSAESTATTEKTSETPEVPATDSKAHQYDKVSQDLWKPIRVNLKAQGYDESGFDEELRIRIPKRFNFRIPSLLHDSTVPYLGEIVGSRRDGKGLAQNETVFIKSAGNDLQVGNTYTLMDEPVFFKDKKSDRTGYFYKSVGEVKIIGVKEDLFVGVISSAYDVVVRGARVYPLLPQVSDFRPIPANKPLESMIVLDPNAVSGSRSQFQFIHFDRGIDDGVQVGNVFRIYEYYDPSTKKKITDNDIMVEADAIVVHVTAQFSTALILRTRGTVERGQFGILVTDLSMLQKGFKTKEKVFDSTKGTESSEDKELDELDVLDDNNSEGVGTTEQKEIRELQDWDKTHDGKATEPTEEPAPKKKEPVAAPEEPLKEESVSEPTLDDSTDSSTTAPKASPSSDPALDDMKPQEPAAEPLTSP